MSGATWNEVCFSAAIMRSLLNSGNVLFYLAAIGALLLPGCAGTVRQTAKEATPGAVEGAIETAKEPDNRGDVAQILADPRIGKALTELTRAVVDGAVDSLTDEQRVARFERFSQSFIDRVGSQVANGMMTELRPQVAAMVSESTDRALEQLLSEETEKRASELTLAISRAAIRGIALELESAPASGGVAPGGGQLGRLAQHASQGFALGFQDAVSKSEAPGAMAKRDRNVLASIGQAAEVTHSIFSLRGLIVIGIILGLIGGLIVALLRARRYHRESERREAELRSLLGAHSHS